MKETVTDDANRFARRGIGKDVGVGLAKNNDACTGVQKQLDRAAACIARKAESEVRCGAIVGDNLAVDEGAVVVGGANNGEESAIRAEDEWSRAHNRDKAVVAEASLGEYVFAWVSKDDGGEVGSVRRSVVGHIWKDGWA